MDWWGNETLCDNISVFSQNIKWPLAFFERQVEQKLFGTKRVNIRTGWCYIRTGVNIRMENLRKNHVFSNDYTNMFKTELRIDLIVCVWTTNESSSSKPMIEILLVVLQNVWNKIWDVAKGRKYFNRLWKVLFFIWKQTLRLYFCVHDKAYWDQNCDKRESLDMWKLYL